VNVLDPARTPIEVVAAVIERPDHRFLLAERPRGKPWAGFWEFPGGKVEPGELAESALRRELHEELGIDASRIAPWIRFDYSYPETTVRLCFFRVKAWRGEPQGREGQNLSWESAQSVKVGPLLPANDRVIQALQLPSIYAITRAEKLGVREFLDRLDAALRRGVRLVQIREKNLSPGDLRDFAVRVLEKVHASGGRVLVNGDVDLAHALGADGVHLSSSQLIQLSEAPKFALWAASCHDRVELERAARLGASFAVLSPVLPTESHPGDPGLGWHRFASLAGHQALPVYALGGMNNGMLDLAAVYGAHGIAMLSGAW